jgi:hypothetical protein
VKLHIMQFVPLPVTSSAFGPDILLSTIADSIADEVIGFFI